MPDKTLSLDKFYTTDVVAERCVHTIESCLASSGLDPDKLLWIDPAAGRHAFLGSFPAGWRYSLDLDPSCDAHKTGNFLEWTPRDHPLELNFTARETVVATNPPFGKNGKTAIQFINHAASFADWIGFVVPVSFRKYPVHRQLDSELKLVHQEFLPSDAFYTLNPLGNRSPYRINTMFQIWSRHGTTDFRRTEPEPNTHKDFDMHQYNNTEDALKVFEEDFDFAVPCQGWQDYSRRETDPAKCEKNKQWMLFKTHTQDARCILEGEDFGNLASQCGTIVPGFRKVDVVEAYSRVWKPEWHTVGTSRGGWS